MTKNFETLVVVFRLFGRDELICFFFQQSLIRMTRIFRRLFLSHESTKKISLRRTSLSNVAAEMSGAGISEMLLPPSGHCGGRIRR